MATLTTARGLAALSPAIIFLGVYLGGSLWLGDFYAVPVSVALMIAAVWSLLIFTRRPLRERVSVFSRAAATEDILYMVWIFILAGAFAALAGGIGAVDATVRLTLAWLPPRLVLPGIFLAACVISMSIGTSVGTVVALTPLVAELAHAADASVPLYVAAVLGGAFFGDNLSFISDTTVAATRSQGCTMDEKFKANFLLVMPAAIITLLIYVAIGLTGDAASYTPAPFSWADMILVAPYLLVIILALAGMNVLKVLTCGIALGAIVAIYSGRGPVECLSLLGSGIDSMSSLIVITLLAAGILGVIKAMGGIDYLLTAMSRRFPGFRGAKASIAVLTAMVNLCTANNTVAIITTGQLARNISARAGIAPRRAASLLDTSSCIVQCLIPFGAQTLLATGMAGISAAAPWPYLYYPWTLALILLIYILLPKK